MNAEKLARGALTLTVIAISLIIFRGSISIFNSIVIPLALYLILYDFSPGEFLTAFFAAFFLVALFFSTQVFFMVSYGLLAFLLSAFAERGIFLRIVILSLGAAVSFLIAIWLTDLILGTAIQRALTALAGGSQTGFYLLVLAEGLAAGGVLAAVSTWLERRLAGR